MELSCIYSFRYQKNEEPQEGKIKREDVSKNEMKISLRLTKKENVTQSVQERNDQRPTLTTKQDVEILQEVASSETHIVRFGETRKKF